MAASLLLAGSATRWWAWRVGADYLAREADAEFDRYSELSVANIGQRVQQQLDLLAGFQTLFRAGNEVSRAEFHRTFTDLQVQTRLPGVQAIRYARWLSEDQRPAWPDRPAGHRRAAHHRPGGALAARALFGLRAQGVLVGDREIMGLMEVADHIFWVRDWRRHGPDGGKTGAGFSPVHSKSLTALYFPGALSARAARHKPG